MIKEKKQGYSHFDMCLCVYLTACVYRLQTFGNNVLFIGDYGIVKE